MRQDQTIRVLSLGAGVQSSDLLIRSLQGEFKHKPDYAVFADVGNEPNGVYQYFDWLKSYVDREFNFTIDIISAGNIYQDALDFVSGNLKRTDGIPLFVLNHDGSKGILRRQCTGYYKIAPIRRHIKSKRPKENKLPVELWLGISHDERQRMKESSVKWLQHRYPLIEHALKRIDCLRNFEKQQLPMPSRSSCAICPYHSDDYWYWLYTNDSDAFEAAILLDEKIRNYPNITAKAAYLHRSCKPLKEVIITIIKRKGQSKKQLSMFSELLDECDGVCGS